MGGWKGKKEAGRGCAGAGALARAWRRQRQRRMCRHQLICITRGDTVPPQDILRSQSARCWHESLAGCACPLAAVVVVVVEAAAAAAADGASLLAEWEKSIKKHF